MSAPSVKPPDPLIETGEESRFLNWCNRLLRFCFSLIVRESSDIAPKYTPDGIFLTIKDKSGGGGNAPTWFRGEYVTGMNVKATQAVVVTGVATGGISQGLYVALVDNPNTHPSDGAPNWMQIASSNFFGNWA